MQCQIQSDYATNHNNNIGGMLISRYDMPTIDLVSYNVKIFKLGCPLLASLGICEQATLYFQQQFDKSWFIESTLMDWHSILNHKS